MRTIPLLLLPLLTVAGCGDDETTDLGTTDLAVSLDGGLDLANNFPAPPTLGAQIDRMGRAGVNTALTDPFYDYSMTATTDAHHLKQDAYNQAADPVAWTQFVGQIKANLAVFDALDNVCGNQAGYGALGMSGYDTLASVLADDRLLVFTGTATCMSYLAVEAATLSGTAPTDCGGRTPTENTIDVTYGVLAAFPPPMGVTNGILSDATQGISNTNFPYLSGPNQ